MRAIIDGSARPRVLQTTILLAAIAVAAVAARPAPARAALPDGWKDVLQWRTIGPANMGGRIAAVAVYEKDPCIWWAATASGGLLKTTNDGFSFEHQFDHEATVSIGDVAVAQSDPQIVWVGTGESNPRNSVSWGNGVHKSVDGGKTWKHMGLDGSFQVGRIAIHPQDPNVVYVGALGRLWGENEERGLFKTTDGGATWTKVLFVDAKTGVIDVRMKPDDPQTLLVATYERKRDMFDTNDPSVKFGEGAGIWKTTDGGATFTRITEGLPQCKLGRIGLDWHRADPNVVYAIVESEKIGQEPEDAAYAGIRTEDADVGARLTEVTEGGPAAAAGLKTGDIVVRVDDVTIHSTEELNRAIKGKLAGATIKVEVSRERKPIVADLTLGRRPGSEEDAEAPRGEGEAESAAAPPRERGPERESVGPYGESLGGQRQNVHDQQGPDGRDFGGVYRSSDAGTTWVRVNSVNPRPMYFSQVRVDPQDASYVYVLGISLYRSKDGGATFTADGGGEAHVDHHALWIDPADGRHMILGNDGGIYVTRSRMDHWDHHNHAAIGQFYHVAVDPRPNYRVYGGLQDNGSWGAPVRARSGGGPINEDWFRIGGGDGFVCGVDREDPDQVYFESQNGGIGRINLRTGERGGMQPRAPRGTRYRFNWRTPFVLSNHNSRIYYVAGNHVFRSLDRGRDLRAISPEITRTDRGSATALAESGQDPSVLYVGTDDGALWMTKDGGATWIDLFAPPAPPTEGAPAEGAAPAGAPAEGAPAPETSAPAESAPAPSAPAVTAPAETAPAPSAPAEAAPAQDPSAERPGGARRGGRFLDALRQADADGDGLIERDEVPERMAGLFERADANADGAIDAKEMEAMAARGPRRGGGGPPAGAASAEVAPSAPAPGAADDPLTGTWSARVVGANVPEGQAGFTLVLRLGEGGAVTGTLTSQFNDGDIEPGTFDAASGKVAFAFNGEQGSFEITGTVTGTRMAGAIDVGGGMFTMDFEADRSAGAATSAAPAAEPAAAPTSVPLRDLVPEPRCVASIETSRFEAGRVYLALDGHRSDDDAPLIFVSEDAGTTWRSLRGDLPDSAGSTRVLREDITNGDILYLGCEFGLWVSTDRGATWTKLNTNLPTVAVHDIAQHPVTGELIAATHGRSLWILDATPLRQIVATNGEKGPRLLRSRDAHYWRTEPSRGGDLRRYVGDNPADGARIFYVLPEAAGEVTLAIVDPMGRTARTLTAASAAGLHAAPWDLRRDARRPPGGAGAATGPGAVRTRGGGGGGGFRGQRGGPRVEPGTYQVVLTVDGEVYRQPIRVQVDPEYPEAVLWGEEYDEMMAEWEALTEGGDAGGEAPADSGPR